MLTRLQLANLDAIELVQKEDRQVFITFNCYFREVTEVFGEIIRHLEL